MRIGLLLLTAGCGAGLSKFSAPHTGGPTDAVDGTTPADTDADLDADTDADADADVDADTDADPHTGGGTPPWTNGDPARPPVVTAGPAPLSTTCAAAGMTPAPITDDPDNEVVVDGFVDTEDTHHLTVATAGWYHLWNDPPANDGTAQWNESIFVRIRNTTFPAGSTVLANCDDDWVTLDGDNVAVVPLAQYLGTFWFDAGENTIDVFHFCPVVRAGLCTTLEDTTDPDTTCSAPDGNRLRMISDGLCVDAP